MPWLAVFGSHRPRETLNSHAITHTASSTKEHSTVPCFLSTAAILYGVGYCLRTGTACYINAPSIRRDSNSSSHYLKRFPFEPPSPRRYVTIMSRQFLSKLPSTKEPIKYPTGSTLDVSILRSCLTLPKSSRIRREICAEKVDVVARQG